MSTYHINPKTGNPGICHAEKGRCPFGSSEEHYESKSEARAAYEAKSDSFNEVTYTVGDGETIEAPYGNGWRGSNYDQKLSTTQIAASIREELKKAVQGNYLPKGLRFKVRKTSHQAISIIIESNAHPDETKDLSGSAVNINSEVSVIRDKVTLIANSFNYDRSESQFDYFDRNFYVNVEFKDSRDIALTQAYKAEEELRDYTRKLKKERKTDEQIKADPKFITLRNDFETRKTFKENYYEMMKYVLKNTDYPWGGHYAEVNIPEKSWKELEEKFNVKY